MNRLAEIEARSDRHARAVLDVVERDGASLTGIKMALRKAYLDDAVTDALEAEVEMWRPWFIMRIRKDLPLWARKCG